MYVVCIIRCFLYMISIVLFHFRKENKDHMQCKFCTLCVHSTYVCVFKTQRALKSHMSRFSSKGQAIHQSIFITLKCKVCDFLELCSEGDITKHLGNHLKVQETMQCPYLDCQFKTNSHSGFNSHRSRKHKRHTISDQWRWV